MRRQRGVALLVVLLILAVMMMVATSISSRFQSALFRTSNLVNQTQARWYAYGSEALVAKVLNQDIKDSPLVTQLGQYWASENQNFPVDGGLITGQVVDAQACFNLNALSKTESGLPAGQLPFAGKVFKQLLIQLQVDDYEAEQITAAMIDWLDSDDTLFSSLGAEDAWYQSLKVPYLTANKKMSDVSEIRMVRGVSPALYRRLLPQVCALPNTDLQINVNTLRGHQAPLMAALFLGNMSNDTGLELIQARPTDGWQQQADFKGMSQVTAAVTGLSEVSQIYSAVVVSSNFFEARMQIEIDTLRLRVNSLFKRANSKVSVIRRLYGGQE